MSLTSYRAAPPRAGCWWCALLRRVVACVVVCVCVCCGVAWRADALHHAGLAGRVWRRPTFPHLGVQYHGRWRFSRPSSGWDRVSSRRHGHQTVSANPAQCAGMGAFRVMPAWAGQVLVSAHRLRCRLVCAVWGLCSGSGWLLCMAGLRGPGACGRLVWGWDEPFGRLGPVG